MLIHTLPLLDLYDRLPKPLHRRMSVEGGAYIAGGSLVRLMLGFVADGAFDIDVWTDEPDELVEELQELGYEPSDDPEFCASMGGESSRLVLIHNDSPNFVPRIDIISQDFGDPEEVTGRFDFRCARVAWDGEKLWAGPGALEDIAEGRLFALRRTTSARITKYEDMGLTLQHERDDVEIVEWATWEQQFGRDLLEVGGEQPTDPELAPMLEPPDDFFETVVGKRQQWGTWWVVFESGKRGTIEVKADEDRDMIAINIGGKVKSIETLPYPAQPVLRRVSGCPEFCHSPSTCQGRTACPKSYACSE